MAWKRKALTFFLSSPAVDYLKSEPKALLARFRIFSPFNLYNLYHIRKRENLKLNLGCGQHHDSEFVNVDLFSPGKTGIRWDLRWSFPFKTNSVSHIHCEHFLEHLEYPGEANQFLRECLRVLAPKATLRLIVPDASKYIEAYAKSNAIFFGLLSDLGSPPQPFRSEIEIINQSFRMGKDHRFAYDPKTLSLLLNDSGFTQIEVSESNSSLYQDLKDSWRRLESCYLTVTK